MSVIVKDLHIEFPDRLLFDSVDLSVNDEEIVAIETGVLDGGTSLLKGIAGFLTGISGSVDIEGVDLLRRPSPDVLYRVGFVYEDMGLLSRYDVYHNICLPLQFHTDLNPLEIHEEVETVCALIGIEEALLPLRPYHLNDVQTRMVNLARALIVNPRLLLIDELEGGMSDDLLEATMIKLRQRQKQNPMAIITTTSSELVMSLADRVFGIENCGLVERATP